MWLAVTVPVALMACEPFCPQITAWRNATMTSDGSLVCARIYGDATCSGFPLQFAVNSSVTELRSGLASLGKAESPLTALIRPGCHLRLWTATQRKGFPFTHSQVNHYSFREIISSTYLLGFYANGVLSARCDCESDNIELLRCEPLVEMVKVQECDYQSSLVGGICPYSVHLQPFRNDNGSIQELTGDTITEDEVSSIKAMFPLHVDARLYDPANDVVEKLVRYVAAGQQLVVKQKVLTCGAYAVPTSEVSETVEVRWLSYRSANKHILISTYNASRSEAVADCSERGFAMASLRQSSDEIFVARITNSLHTLGWSSTRGYWTAAVLEDPKPVDFQSHPGCLIAWPGVSTEGMLRIVITCDEYRRSVIGHPNTDGTWSYEAANRQASNLFICEMTL